MLGYITSYNATLSTGWHGARSSTAFGTELLAANDNIGLTGLLAPDALSKVELELDDLAKLNLQFVTIGRVVPHPLPAVLHIQRRPARLCFGPDLLSECDGSDPPEAV
jgi:hypothetical protein